MAIEILAQAGLGSLSPIVDQWLIQGLTELQILAQLRERTEWKTRFGAIEDFKARFPGLQPPSEADVLNFEVGAMQVFRSAEIPSGFYDSPDDFRRLIGNGVSLRELQERVEAYRVAAFQVPEATRQELDRLYGIGPGELTAFFIDPDKGQEVIMRQFTAAQVSGAFREAGLGSLEAAQAEVAGALSQEQVQRGTETVTRGRELFQAQAGEEAISVEDQVKAAFGTDAAAQEKVQRRASRRKAEFEGGGSYVTTREGVTGLG